MLQTSAGCLDVSGEHAYRYGNKSTDSAGEDTFGAKCVSVTYGQLEKVFVRGLRVAVRERAVVLAVVPALLASSNERE